jgi:hypothetical protein
MMPSGQVCEGGRGGTGCHGAQPRVWHGRVVRTRSLIVICWMMPSLLMMNSPRSAMPARSSSTP